MKAAIPHATNAAEGLPRRAFTFAELEQMTAAGILQEGERIELIGGEIVQMWPRGEQHETLRTVLNIYWVRQLPEELLVISPTTFRMSDDTYFEPDFVFYPKEGGWKGLGASTARLVVEIADSSLAYDIGRKAGLYASFGIAELWVIHAVTLQARIHREPSPSGYRSILDVPPSETLVPAAAPALAVTLAELDLR
jgi:Uma2 family endonuclease